MIVALALELCFHTTDVGFIVINFGLL